jgi:hypothetical protein
MSTDLVETDLSKLTVHEISKNILNLEEALRIAAGALVGDALRTIISAYPASRDFADPQRFVDQAMVALEDFPALIINELANPKVGIVRDARFLPRIAELVKWCERRIVYWRLACDGAREVIAERERAAAIRRLERESAEAAREENASIAKAKEIEPEILHRLHQLAMRPSDRRPRRGEERARNTWQTNMAARLSRRPDLVEPYISILEQHPELVCWATEQENTYRGSGWAKLSLRMFDLFESRRASMRS